MNAQIVRRRVVDSALDMVHGAYYTVTSLYLPEEKMLVHADRNKTPTALYVLRDFPEEHAEEFEVVQSLDVPGSLIDELIEWAEAKDRLISRCGSFLP